jgi:hypothetical protein
MFRKVGAFVILVAAAAPGAMSAGPDLPEIMAGPGNAVPECVTPGRLMAFLKMRNPRLDPRYEAIATQYMRYGEQFGVRWDYAFYQMVVETGALRFTGDVRPEQFNFAGLGATGRGERGESFKDMATGVRAHMEHILLYAGHPVAQPVAERTRKVRDWGLLNAWQRSFKRPITYSDLAAKWAPGAKSYVAMLQTISDRFRMDVCGMRDPRPQLVQEARALIAAEAKVADAATPALSPGEELALRAIAQGKAEGVDKHSALGAAAVATTPPATAPSAPSAPSAPYKVLNPPSSAVTAPASAPPAKTAALGTAKAAAPAARASVVPDAGPAEKAAGSRFVLAGAAGAAATRTKPPVDTATPPAANQKCRVWTASYGGQKSIIIRSVADQVVNFTVLDVNAGSETREAQAFIAAYAKNGKITGEYPNQAQALDKAFELCPEG